MKVWELIEKLREIDPNLPVTVEPQGGPPFDPEVVTRNHARSIGRHEREWKDERGKTHFGYAAVIFWG